MSASLSLTTYIKAIKFSLLSPEVIRKMSAAQIITSDTYDEDGLPIEGGLMDRRLGTIEPGRACRTCGNFVGKCPGHFGHIELTRPVIHVGFTKVIYNLLKVICRECSSLLINPKDRDRYLKLLAKYEKSSLRLKRALTNYIFKKTVKNPLKICPKCGAEQYLIKLEKPTSFYEERPEGSIQLSPSDIRFRFEKISDDDIRLLGFDPECARPEWMILTVLPVPPIAVRPSITLESGIRSEDDLTHKLVDVVRANQRLREVIEFGAPQLIIDDHYNLLQYHINTYFDNEIPGIPPARHRTGRNIRALAQRLKGKEGRFRSNLSGKRVDFSSRTVISPDPNLSINEVGVPIEVAKILTVSERVTFYNIEWLKELVRRGPFEYPGANYIVRPDGRRIDLRYPKDRSSIAEALEIGAIVERHLQDGDIVLFNRQPSLHRMSMMAHRVRVLPYRTFRLNLCVCPPYNADFDGDEMNLHVPESEEARAEAEVLMLVQEHISSPRYGGPIIGAIQDYITGAFLLSLRSTLLSKEEVVTLLSKTDYKGELPPPAIKKPAEYWTGKQVISTLIPSNISMILKANTCEKCPECLKELCPHDAYVIIKEGELLTGVIDKRTIGAQVSESLIHRIIKENGTSKAAEFIDKAFKLFLWHISTRGFTTGIDDEDIPEEAQGRIKEILNNAKKKVELAIESYKTGELKAMPGQTLEETLESEIMKILSEARDSTGKIAELYLKPGTPAVTMAKTGARGSILNMIQMITCVGQQSQRGRRISRGYRDRTLPHFRKGDLGPEAKGFIVSSYKIGLSPTEFFFHAISGREALVDTAVRTSQSGYMQRRLINALQDIHVDYNESVRDSDGHIIQFKYGDDGVDPSKSDHGKAVNIDKIIESVLGA